MKMQTSTLSCCIAQILTFFIAMVAVVYAERSGLMPFDMALLAISVLVSGMGIAFAIYVAVDAFTRSQVYTELVPGEIRVPERCVTCGHMVCEHGEHGCTVMVEAGSAKGGRACGCQQKSR